jgi:hypothetical protein
MKRRRRVSKRVEWLVGFEFTDEILRAFEHMHGHKPTDEELIEWARSGLTGIPQAVQSLVRQITDHEPNVIIEKPGSGQGSHPYVEGARKFQDEVAATRRLFEEKAPITSTLERVSRPKVQGIPREWGGA